MPLFKVTEKKLEECLGEPYREYCHPWKSKRLILLESLLICGGILFIIMWWINPLPFIFFIDESYIEILKRSVPWVMFAIYIVVMPFVLYFILCHEFFIGIAYRMRDLVNDPQLQWLNFSEDAPSMPTGKEIIFKRYTYPFGKEFFYVLSYLKMQKTDYGMEWKTWKNNSSARIFLSRLAKKGILSAQGGNYQYEEWRFRIIDKYGRFLESPEYARKETLLNNAWERMMGKGVRSK